MVVQKQKALRVTSYGLEPQDERLCIKFAHLLSDLEPGKQFACKESIAIMERIAMDALNDAKELQRSAFSDY